MAKAIDYDIIAANYAKHRRVHPEVLRCLTSNLTPESTVLEVGCGTGNHVVAIDEFVGCRCRGTEPSAEMLAHAANRSSRVQFSPGKAESLDFSDGTFDLVFSVDVIHHVGDRHAFFREAHRVLRPGGKVCTATDSEAIIRSRRPLAEYFPETVDVDLARYPRIGDLQCEMRVAGFAGIVEENVEFAHELADISPYQAKAFSCLRLISEEAFVRGIARMERDLEDGPISCVSRYCLVGASRSS